MAAILQAASWTPYVEKGKLPAEAKLKELVRRVRPLLCLLPHGAIAAAALSSANRMH